MRTKTFALIAGTAVFLSLFFWWIIHKPPVENEVLIPEDVLAFIQIDRFPPDLESLRSSRLWEYIELSAENLTQIQSGSELSGLYAQMQEQIQRAWICVHRLQKKPSGSYRIDFSAWIEPKRGRREQIQNGILDRVRRHFGPQRAESQPDSDQIILVGDQEGQILYFKNQTRTLYFSNSESAWKKYNLDSEKKFQRLEGSPQYQTVIRQLPKHPDVLFYFRGIGLLPEFGYAIIFQKDQLEDYYYSPEE